MRIFKFVPIAALLLATSIVWAGDEEAMVEKPSFSATQSMIVSAVVDEIDHESRVVTVTKADGESLTFVASEEARNLDQVAVGDVLVAEYMETVSIEVFANDGMEPEQAQASAMARTKKGEMPGVAAMDTTIITATVEEINLEMNTFKLKGPDGTVEEYVARNPENLKRAAVGDLVVITLTSAVAVTVQEATTE
jgi:hypothetical protein